MITGLEKLQVDLEKIGNPDLTQALQQCCLMVENDAKINCPVDTGILRNSITHTVSPTRGEVGTNLEYSPYVHEGTGLFATHGDGRQDVPWRYQDAEGNWHTTSGQHPQPFLGDALKSNAREINNILTQAMGGKK